MSTGGVAFQGGGSGGTGRGPGGGRGGGFGRGGGSSLPREILTRLGKRRRNPKVVSLDFKLPNLPILPSLQELWDWLSANTLTDVEGQEIDYFEREVMEKKFYIVMKEESGAEWLAKKFETGLKFPVSEGLEVVIKARKEGEMWKAVLVKGVCPEAGIKSVENVFKQYGDVKEAAFVEFGTKGVKANEVNLKVKLEEGKSLPGYVMASIGEGVIERWEVINKGLGGPKVCNQCYQQGHIRKNCPNQPATMAEIEGGTVVGGAISYAQVLAGTKARVAPPPQPPKQPHQVANALTRRTASQDPASQENGAVTSGQHSGENVSLSLVSPVAVTNQELEAAELTSEKQQPLAAAAELIQQVNNGEAGMEAVDVEIEKLRSEIEEGDGDKGKKKKELERIKRRIQELQRKEDNDSRERKRKARESGSHSSERRRTSSEKRRREEQEDRKSRRDYAPHQGNHGKQKSGNDRPASRSHGSNN